MKILTFDLYGTLVDWKNGTSKVIEFICPNTSEKFFETEFSTVKELKSYTPYSKVLAEVLKKTFSEKT